MKRTFFISDLHLCDEEPVLTELFLDFIQTETQGADALYLLGDIFAYWIGDDQKTQTHDVVARALKRLGSKMPVYIQHGNRDFLIGETFAKACGAKMIPDPHLINLYGQNILLLHGDSLCLADTAHQRFRRLTRNNLIKKSFLRLPLSLRIWIAKQLRTHSSGSSLQRLPESIKWDITRTEIPRLMEQYQANIVIHGHTHRPEIHLIKTGEVFNTHIVLSDWHTRAHACVIDDTGGVVLY